MNRRRSSKVARMSRWCKRELGVGKLVEVGLPFYISAGTLQCSLFVVHIGKLF